MATERPAGETLSRIPAVRSSASSIDEDLLEEEREIGEMEREVAELGRRILECRRTVPDALLRALSSRLLGLRPPLPPPAQALAPTDAATSITMPFAEIRTSSSSIERNLAAEANGDMLEKLNGLKSKVAANAAAMPILLKRINECIVDINKLEQCNVDIHPVFTRKR